MVVKESWHLDHLKNLYNVLERLLIYNKQINPLRYLSSLASSQFHGYLMGLKPTQSSLKITQEMPSLQKIEINLKFLKLWVTSSLAPH